MQHILKTQQQKPIRTDSTGIERIPTESNGIERKRTETNGIERNRTETNGFQRFLGKGGLYGGTTGGDRYRSFGLTAFETPTRGVGGFLFLFLKFSTFYICF